MSDATIYDVAERARVAISTVSKVLSGRHRVSEQTRRRVLEAVAELNYVPSSAAQALASERSSMIAFVIGYNPREFFSDPAIIQVLEGITQEVTERDYSLLLSTPRSGDERVTAFQRLIRGQRVDGVLIESGLGEEGIKLLAEASYPCVVIGYSEHGLPCVYPDDFGGSKLMAHHLAELGHRRIGVVTGPRVNRRTMLARFNGFREGLKKHEVVVADEMIAYGDYGAESGYRGAAQLMNEPNPPTAIYAFNDRMAFGAIRWLHEHGLSVPDDVSVAGFDDIPHAAECAPTITTIHSPLPAIGQQATRMLFDMIENGRDDSRPQEIALPVRLVIRGSTSLVRNVR
jgi:DNA-binding LacI/PurR family transcriptional regulator